MGIRVSMYQGTRHSSATEAATRVSMDVISEFLGHTSLRMSRRYVKQNPDRLKGALRVVK
jgi:integrase